MLDVGAGGGAASLPLCPPAASVTAVDQSPGMLAAFAKLAEQQGVDHREVEGLWPDVAARSARPTSSSATTSSTTSAISSRSSPPSPTTPAAGWWWRSPPCTPRRC